MKIRLNWKKAAYSAGGGFIFSVLMPGYILDTLVVENIFNVCLGSKASSAFAVIVDIILAITLFVVPIAAGYIYTVTWWWVLVGMLAGLFLVCWAVISVSSYREESIWPAKWV